MNTITIIDQETQFVCERISSAEGFESPQRIVNVADVAKKSGAAYLGAKFGRRNLSWRCLIDDDSAAQRRALLNTLTPGRLKTIQFQTCDGILLETEVEITNIIMPYRIGRSPALIEAVAPNAAFLGQEVKEFDTSQTTIMGGGSIPAEVPMSLYSTGTTVGSIENLGNLATSPTFRIEGPGSQFIIGNATTGEEFIIEYIIGEGEYIEVMRSEENGLQILFNGETPIYSSFSGNFWEVQPGENMITFVPTAGEAATKLIIFYQDGYIGI